MSVGNVKTKECLNCGSKFKARVHNKKYCCDRCAASHKRRGMTSQEWDDRKNTCTNCGKEFTTNYKNKAKFCSTKCSLRYKKDSAIPYKVSKQMYEEQEGRCIYCEEPIASLRQCVKEHIDPSLKGTDRDGEFNWVISCHPCNSSKGNRFWTWLYPHPDARIRRSFDYDPEAILSRLRELGKRIPPPK